MVQPSNILIDKEITIAIFFAYCALTSQAAGAQTVVEFKAPMTYGTGYNSASSQVMGQALTPLTPVSVPGSTDGQVVTFDLKQITSSNDLHKELDVDAAMSLGFLMGKVSASAKYADKIKMNSFSNYLLVRTTVENAFKQLPSIRLKPGMLNLVQRSPQSFKGTYGDTYVSGIHQGGEFFGVIEFKSQSREHQRDLSTKIRGRVGSFKGSAEVTSALDELAKSSDMTIHCYQRGGGAQNAVPPTDFDTMKQRASQMPVIVGASTNAASNYRAVLMPYYTISPAFGNKNNMELQQLQLSRLNNQIQAYKEQINDIDYVLGHRDEFQSVDQTSLLASKSLVEQALHDRLKIAAQAFTQILATLPAAPTISVKLPERIPEQLVRVDATNAGWTPANLHLEPNDKIIVHHVQGRWTISKPGFGNFTYVTGNGYSRREQSPSAGFTFKLPASNLGCLVGKIGNEIFELGDDSSYTTVSGGDLSLAINDAPETPGYGDNDGQITFSVIKRNR